MDELTSFLFGLMRLNGMAIYEDSWDTLERAVSLKRYLFLNDEDGIASGFLTWNIDSNKIWVNNLTIFPAKRGKVNLIFLRKFFRDKYPGYKFGWHNDRHIRLIEKV